MDNDAGSDAQRAWSAREQILHERETVIVARESALRAREGKIGEIELLLHEREGIAGLQEAAARFRTEAEHVTLERERLLVQMRIANEQLLLTALRADELTEQAEASRSLVIGSVKAAVDANRAKDEFLAMLGHELRNPLAPILTALDLMTMRDSAQFQRERTIIERQVHYLVRLVDDLLDISRITGGKIELVREVLDLADIVARAVEIAAPLYEAKAHNLTVAVKPGLLVHGDSTRLTQVISNLLTNAAKYTPKHGTIDVIGELRGSTVALVVRDNGIGISAQMLPRVFQLFAQETQAIDRPAGGLGLGLAIVQSLAGLHGGTVTATSEGLGLGSEFALELPAWTEALETKTIPHHPVTARVPILVSRKVLIVDDNPDAAELMALALGRRGHEVRIAHDAPTALEVVKGFRPDVALLDIVLPVIDGYELAQLIRDSLAPHRLELIAITGYGQPADRERSKESGFALHLVKPVSTSRLEQAIREATRALDR